MISYSVDIRDNTTGEVRRTPMWAGWTQYSPLIYRETMCDCNLAGYRERGYVSGANGEWTWGGGPHEAIAYTWRKTNGGCDHSMPPTRLTALRAYLQDGRIFDLETGEEAKAA